MKNSKPYKLFITGDIHGRWGNFNQFLNTIRHRHQTKPIYVLCCGDFGYWPNLPNNLDHKDYGIKNHDIKVYFCDGNHDHHWELAKLKDNEIIPNVYYKKRGSVLTLPDDKNVLFMGGAASIDKYLRTPGVDWFPEETICDKDLDNLPDMNINMVVSHTCPSELVDIMCDMGNKSKLNDPSPRALSYILEKYNPECWFFGHWHTFKPGKLYNTEWRCLNMCNYSNWWYEFC